MAGNPDQRTLSKAEARRAEEHARLREGLERDGWRAHELVVGMSEVNTRGMLVGIACSLPFIAAYLTLHGAHLPSSGQLLAWCVVYLALIPTHEAIHGLTWGLCNPRRFKAVEFGFVKEYLTPYCTCTQPLTPQAYLAGALMPGLALGLLPAVAGVALGNGVVFMLGVFMIWGASGDMLVAARIARYIRGGAAQGRTGLTERLCVDHPSECGVVVFERER